MKNLSVILNIVLLVAVGVLYYLHFSGNGSATVSGASGVNAGDLKIAYVNTDSILTLYDFVDEKREVLEAKQKRLEQDWQNRATSLQGEFEAYQRNASNMTIGQVRAIEENLGKKQQNLQLFQQQIEQELMNDQGRLSKDLYDRLTGFLKTYSTSNGVQVVLQYSAGSDVLYGGQALDITSDVLKGLNEAYKNEKSGLTPADSTAKK